MMQTIKSIDKEISYEKITAVIFSFEDSKTCRLDVYGDCCSFSWIEEIDNFEQLIGKTIIGLNLLESDVDLPESGVQDCDDNYIYELKLSDGDSFRFYLRNSSNGYYSGSASITGLDNAFGEVTTNNLVFIAGLPGSGKTEYAKKNYPDYTIYDDAISDGSYHANFPTTKIIKSLMDGGKVVIIAPFVNIDFYNKTIESLHIKNVEDIKTICFIPNVDRNIENVNRRDENSYIKSRKLHDIYSCHEKMDKNIKDKMYYGMTFVETFDASN